MDKEKSNNDVNYAGFWIRLVAAFLDGIVISALVSFVMLAFGRRYGIFNPQVASSAGSLLAGSSESLVTTLFQWAFNVLMLKYYGATLGKMAMKIHVESLDKQLDWVSIILRETIGKFVSGILLGIGYLMVAWDPKKQALHDKIAGTVVVKE